MKTPYLILHKQSRILNTPNSVACVFDDIGSKCKMMYHFKISAEAGIQSRSGRPIIPELKGLGFSGRFYKR